jgi:predicted membrane protein
MTQKTLFIIQAVLVTILLSFHYFAFQHDLYWHYLWLDIPMHFVGGLWAALVSAWFLRYVHSPYSLVYVLIGVLIIGIAWEIMEYVIGFQREQDYAFDTSLDLVMDLCGGVLGFLAARVSVRDTILEQ